MCERDAENVAIKLVHDTIVIVQDLCEKRKQNTRNCYTQMFKLCITFASKMVSSTQDDLNYRHTISFTFSHRAVLWVQFAGNMI